jgi:hypothetical protein
MNFQSLWMVLAVVGVNVVAAALKEVWRGPCRYAVESLVAAEAADVATNIAETATVGPTLRARARRPEISLVVLGSLNMRRSSYASMPSDRRC